MFEGTQPKSTVVNYAKRVRHSLWVGKCHVLIQHFSSQLVIDMQVIPTSLVFHSAHLQKMPNLCEMLFNSLLHLYQFIQQNPQNVSIRDLKEFVINVQAFQQQIPIIISLEQRQITEAEWQQYEAIKIQLEVSSLVSQQRRALMRIEEDIRQLKKAIDDQKMLKDDLAKQREGIAKEIEGKIAEREKYAQFLGIANKHILKLKQQQGKIVNIDE